MQDTRTIENLKEILSRYNDSLIEEKKELFTPKKILKEINDSRKKMKEVIKKEPLNIKKVLEESLNKIKVIKNEKDAISLKEIDDSLVVLSLIRKEIEELQNRSEFLKNIVKYFFVFGITLLSVYIGYSYYR
ncbi:hypothetical protein CWI37_0085p0050 [Hamiltosporidium tvaerminnensis]|uniref:Uncharacterized protein n=1 Tax=Hamiltosporidium tvaerminnensis TaxID=1176355 RepID=A0A4Q9LBU5_9MICR|nr:hypothetical protein LUQ84_3486 [Hamiltosporidium tvaerminnensis]TBU04815.1 hypothetical protein CWI37_0085p0050 [Hamiltosporidium tvaerminnensis]